MNTPTNRDMDCLTENDPTSAPSAALAALYARIPAVDCIPGCTACCGVIPMNQAEARAFGPFPLFNMDPMAMAMDASCPNSKARNCRIHDQRPFICRLFGTVDGAKVIGTSEARMACPHGRKPTKPLTGAQASALMAEYLTLSNIDGANPDSERSGTPTPPATLVQS